MTASLTDSTGRRWRPADVTALCEAAAVAWRLAPGRARRVRFCWHGRWWVASHTALRLLVHDPAGHPIASRWD